MTSRFVHSSALANGQPLATHHASGTVRVTFIGRTLVDGTKRPNRTFYYYGVPAEVLAEVDEMADVVNRDRKRGRKSAVSIGRDVVPLVKAVAEHYEEVTE